MPIFLPLRFAGSFVFEFVLTIRFASTREVPVVAIILKSGRAALSKAMGTEFARTKSASPESIAFNALLPEGYCFNIFTRGSISSK